MLFMRLGVIMLGLMFSIEGFAQQLGRQYPSLYDDEAGLYMPRGFYLGPGLSYMLPGSFNRAISTQAGIDTSLRGQLEAGGKLGMYFEAGHGHLLPHWMPFEYLDYGISFKLLRGKESFNGEYYQNETGEVLGQAESRSSFSDGNLCAQINLGKFFQVGDYRFILLAVGANGDYRLLSRDKSTPALLSTRYPPDFFAQLHLRLGYGYKLQPNLFVIPSLEVPLVGAYPFEKGSAELSHFSSRYRPILFSLRFQWLTRRKPDECVGKPKGKKGEDLWDPSMRRKKK